MTTYTKSVAEPWFSLILLGLKTVEGRLNKGAFAKMQKGDTIIFTNDDFKLNRTVEVVIKDIRHYKTFRTYLTTQGLDKCLPGFDTIDDGLKVYHLYYPPSVEVKHGVLAIIW